jgi:hypothetical protein
LCSCLIDNVYGDCRDCYCCMTNSNQLYYIKYKLSDFIFILYIISS